MFKKRWGVYLHYEDGRKELGPTYWTERGAQNFINWVVKNTNWSEWVIDDGAPSLSVARIP